jgi:hypothetical protein
LLSELNILQYLNWCWFPEEGAGTISTAVVLLLVIDVLAGVIPVDEIILYEAFICK